MGATLHLTCAMCSFRMAENASTNTWGGRPHHPSVQGMVPAESAGGCLDAAAAFEHLCILTWHGHSWNRQPWRRGSNQRIPRSQLDLKHSVSSASQILMECIETSHRILLGMY